MAYGDSAYCGGKKMIEIGRICVKIAGRDANKKCVVVDILNKDYVLIDGETRRRKCNVIHLEPLNGKIELEKNASHGRVKEEFVKLGWKVKESKVKEKKEKPVKVRGKKKAKVVEVKKPKKKIAKKKEKKVVEGEVKEEKTIEKVKTKKK